MQIYEARLVYSLIRDGQKCPLDSPESVVEYMVGAFDECPVQEQFWVIYLNRRNRPLGRHQSTVGTLSSTLVAPREVFRGAILASASSVILVHNHPSGDPAPSSADVRITRSLREAGTVLEIDVLDHVIIGESGSDPIGLGFYSFRQAGVL